MTLDSRLLEVLACPVDKGPLHYVAGEGLLYNPRQHRCYDVVDDIPVMLVEASRIVEDAEHERLMALISADEVPPLG